MKRILLIIYIFLVLTITGIIIYFSLGSEVTKNIDTYIYDLPFQKGTNHKVVQGYGGLFSHENKAALDFAMPEGTAIHASRDGKIYSYKDDSDEGGPFTKYARKANYIIVQHDDGSFGCYWHLQKNGVAVKKRHSKKRSANWLQWKYRFCFTSSPAFCCENKTQLSNGFIYSNKIQN